MFTQRPDLASRALGGSVMYANDESFADKECLIRVSEPEFTPENFGSKGQIYDGWETRRRREPGFDFAVIRLGVPGTVTGIVIDTAHFKGNYPPECSVEGVYLDGHPSIDELLEAEWKPLLAHAPIKGHTKNEFEIESEQRVSHLRLIMHPDGGIARLRAHGEPQPSLKDFADLPLDLAAITNGGRCLESSNTFYSNANNTLLPGHANHQADGWETGRRRGPGNDWMRLKLAGRGTVDIVEIDTTHMKFNAPGGIRLRGFDADSGRSIDDDSAWFDMLPRTRVQPDGLHRFRVRHLPPATHAQLDIYPDGGIARLRLTGTLTEAAQAAVY
ncbi:allantoicase [Haloglycomyces albus]|uniref:allantoicase n=1 Tax=Haloglycomyces albus TaxID=526067 RepID=UPI00046D6B3D|nr:allantoicase [Haloglycomyces albus]